MSVIALDLGGTKLSAAILNRNGTLSHKKYFPLNGRTGQAVGKLITEAIREITEEARQDHISLSAVGICVPGISHPKTGTVWAPNIPGWDNYPLHDEIESSLQDDFLSVIVDNDRACSVLGECWKGAARGCENAIFIAIGTGIGAGILADGRVLRGVNDIAGAAGWMALQPPYEKKYDACGNFEYAASGEGLIRAAKDFVAEDENYKGTLQKNKFNTEDVFEAYKVGDGIAVKTVQQAITYWGMATANFISIFNPEKIIFGGGVFGRALQFLPEIKVEAEKWAQPVSIRQVTLTGSVLGSDAGLYGAAFQALAFGLENKG